MTDSTSHNHETLDVPPLYGRFPSDISDEQRNRSYLLSCLPQCSNAELALLYDLYLDNVGSGYWPDVMDEIQSRGLTLDDIESFLD